MGLLGKFIQTAVDVAVLPVEVVRDVVSLPSTAYDDKSPMTNTTERWKKLNQHAGEFYDDLENL